MFPVEPRGISDDEETEFVRLHGSGEIPITDLLWAMELVEQNSPENYRAAANLDCDKQPRKMCTGSSNRTKRHAIASFDELFPDGRYICLDAWERAV